MGFRHAPSFAAATFVVALALTSAPASAHNGPHPELAGNGHHAGETAGYGMAPEARDAWLAECRDRVSHGRRIDPDDGRCETYLDQYYAYYRGAAHHGGHAYAGCCQPLMMVPVTRLARAEPECTETVEYEYVDVPVRAAPRPRPAPQKRVKVVPDKRVKIVPAK